MSPFGYNKEYKDWDSCISQNSDKDNPDKYCGWIKHQTEDTWDTYSHNCLMKAYQHYKERFPNLSERDIYDKTFAYFRNNDVNDFINTCDYNQDGKCINERNENYKKECPYENIDKCPTSDFVEDINDLDFLPNIYVENNVNAVNPELIDVIYFYVPLDKIRGDRDGKWEHNAVYDIDKKEYYQNFPPVPVKYQKDGSFEFSDGFHRVNFCIRENLPVPCMVSKKKNGTHTHVRSMGTTSFEYIVKDEDCNDDLTKGGIRKCEKDKYPIYDKERKENYEKVKDLLNKGKLLLSLKKGTGKGWWGESERHSKARKTGHADLCEDMNESQIIENYDHNMIIMKYNQLRQKYPEYSERELLMEVFSRIRKDFTKDLFSNKVIDELDQLEFNGDLFIRWSNSIEDVDRNSFELFDNIINDTIDIEDLAFGLYKRGLLPDKIEEQDEYEWQNYTEILLKKARKGNLDAQKDILKGFIERRDIPYYVEEREIDGKKVIGLEAKGVNVTFGGGGGSGVPTGIKYISYLKGEILDDNIQHDGLILDIDKIVAIYDNKKNQFIKLDKNYLKEKLGDKYNLLKNEGKGKGWHGESERHSKARKTGHADLIGNIYDLIEDQIGSKITGPEKTRNQQQLEQLKALDRLRKQNIIPAPYQMINTETGAILSGQVLYNQDKFTKQMTPVSSTNVKAIGQFKNELLAQFHAKGAGGFTHTYRYQFETPQDAEEAYKSMLDSSSPGRWVWHNIRGHAKGEPTGIQNVPQKYGPAITDPNQQVLGGTSSSLVEYNISNRTPISKMTNFEKIAKQLKRRRANVSQDPSTGSRVEGLLGTRKGLRNLKTKDWRSGTKGLPRRDFVGNIFDLIEDYKVKGHYRTLKSGERVWIRKHTRGEGTSIKEKPRMRPLYEWEIKENYQNQIAKEFGKEKYSKEIEMNGKKDHFGRSYHSTISIADNVNYDKMNFSISLANGALKMLPLDFQLDFLDIVFYDKITDDPDFQNAHDDVPTPYRKVGWTSTWDDVVAQISYKQAKIRIKADNLNYGQVSSIRHEVGHAVWWWGISQADKQRYKELWEQKMWHLRRQDKVGKYQANDINEFFAVQFEYYYGKKYDQMFLETKTYFDYLNKRHGGEMKL